MAVWLQGHALCQVSRAQFAGVRIDSRSSTFFSAVSPGLRDPVVGTPRSFPGPSRRKTAMQPRAGTEERDGSGGAPRLIGSSPSWLESAINGLASWITASPLNVGKKRLARMQAGSYDKKAVREKMDALIKDNPVVVFSWTYCPFAKRAKQLLTDLGARYKAVEMDTMADGLAIRAELAELTNRTSVPNVFIGGRSYGGCNDGPGVRTLHKQGKLEPLLQEAGAL